MSKYLYYCLLCLVALGATACMSEDDTAQHKALVDQREFELLSVVSHQRGQAVSLSLDLEQSGEDLRSLQVNEQSSTGALELVNVGTTEQMHLFLYKEGEPASLSTATITWQGRTQTSIKLNKIDFNLAPGYSFRTGDTWLVSGVLGGQLDPQTRRVQMGAPRSADAERAFPADAMVDMPYALSWQRMSITRDNYGTIPKATLQPMGTLLRLNFYSNMLEDYTASALQLETNALRPTGTFDPMADTALGALPGWTAEEADSDTPLVWNYRLGNTARSLTLPAGGGYDAGRTLYLWAMPTGVSEQNTATSIRLNVAPTGQSGTPSTQTTYKKRGHRTLKSGRSYRLSNVLTSDLIISEVYYQFSAAGQNPDYNANQNYSIVELYNPTASEINLSDYALARTVYYANNRYAFSTQADLSAMPNSDQATIDYSKVFMMALSTVMGNDFDFVGFSNKMGHYGAAGTSERGPQGETVSNGWHRVLAGTPSLRLKPGQTMLIGADGYIPRYYTDKGTKQLVLSSPSYHPGTNIEQYNQLRQQSPSLAAQALEKDYLPRAGMQIDSAVRAGYAQFMVAIDNGSSPDKKAAPNATARTGIMLMDNGDGFALFKRAFTEEQGRSLELVDITTPILSSEASRQHREKLVREYNQQAQTDITELVSKDRIAYSVVRVGKSNFPRSAYVAEDWQVAVSENGGVKSLGTRHYVAGLSPFGPTTTGYSSANNPLGLPFWSSAKAFATPTRQWASILGQGENLQSNAIEEVSAGAFRPVPIASATATEQQAAHPIGNSYDKNLSTFYHSKNKSQNPALPITLTYHLAQPETLSHIIYHPRDQNGSINKVEVIVTYEDGSTAVVLNKNLGSPTSATRLEWDGIESRKIKTVAFRVHSTYYGVLAVSEMEFITQDTNYVDPTTIFSDVLCTQLRPGITFAQIQAITDPYYRDLARQIYQGTYKREFRVAEYQSYPDPHRQQKATVTQFAYSRYDNPTGIAVQNGERLIVFVDNPSGQPAKLHSHDFRTNTEKEYSLNQGMNVLRAEASGLLYLLYHSPENRRGAYANIRLHILGGTVNGYYDSQNPKHQGRWRELLSKATHEHFDVMSDYTHLIYPTEKFRQYVAEPKPLLDMYDRFVVGEWELLGFYKYPHRRIHNRMECRVMYGAYMNATTYRTAYNTTILENLMKPDKLKAGPWGPAHEMGHMNQTNGLNWDGMIEVTVNIFASYVQFVTLGNTFRGLQPNEDWFTRGWNRLLEKPGVTLSMMSQDGDPVTSMFQLELYLGQVLGKTPTKMADKGGFYPELFELLRQVYAGKDNVKNDPVSSGNQQAELAYYASKAAGLDLTDFFERWGYLRPVDNVEFVNTYGATFRITLTQQKVDQVKAQIRALGLPKPGVAFEYITTRNMDMFRTPRAVVPGTASRDGQTLRFTGWQNVVAWEVVDASGGLVYTSTGWQQDFAAGTAGFTLPVELPWQTGYRVRAISAAGQRTVVTL